MDKKRNEPIILDGHKLAWHKDRVEAWLKGERIVPITIDYALTRACNFKCTYCYSQLQKNDNTKMTKDHTFRFLDDCAELGVKGVILMGDGESTVSPHFAETLVYGKKKGVDMAVATNGALLKEEELEKILGSSTWFRFNISAGVPKRYSEIHGCKEKDFYKVIENIKKSVKIKKDKKLDVTIGMQMVFLPKFKEDVIPLTKLGKDLGVDYLVIKHCSDDEKRELGSNYKEYLDSDLINTLEEAEAYSTDNYFVKAKWSKILSGGEKKYSKCYGTPFLMQLSGSGLVAPCGQLFNSKYKQHHIGNITETSFKDILKSDKYWEVINHLASDNHNVHTDCGIMCCQDRINEYLWNVKQGSIKLEEPKGKPPQHINFI
ncbi:radical SAM protein [Candidatus Pacearchaeota archaeon]|jgi:MoaA/NifB/PqqE/SkfB family radical SAM enzyme|nr:radical SAM protein [Candidatus Pacearchaeota archaeon]|tara:strand:+ start:28214 stop:29338 length:1125 start_codon:yes stop_codon:yes gene_type:complete